MTQNTDYQMDFYKKMRKNVHEWAASDTGRRHRWMETVLLAPDLLYLMIRLSSDPDVPLSVKARLVLTTLYMVNPIDLMPELFLGPIGFLDDVILVVLVLHQVFEEVDAEILERHWMGQKKLLFVVQDIARRAHRIVGHGIFRKLKHLYSKFLHA